MVACVIAGVDNGVVEKPEERPAPIQISAEANKGIQSFCDRNERDTISRILLWFLSQPPPVRTVVLGVQDEMESEYADALEKMASDLRKKLAERLKEKPDGVPFKILQGGLDGIKPKPPSAPGSASQRPGGPETEGRANGQKKRRR
jgi:hypothetical protein